MPHNQPYLDHFLEMLSVEKGASIHTIDAYRRDVNHFLIWLASTGVTIEEVNSHTLEEYLKSLHADISDRSKARRLSALKQFFRFLLHENIIKDNPASPITPPRQRKTVPKTLTENDIDKLFTAAYNNDHPDQPRRVVFLELLYATGMRISELLNLKLSDIHWEEESIRVWGKGNKERLIPLHSTAIEALQNYVQSSYHITYWLFPSKGTEKPLTRQRFFQIIRGIALEANLNPQQVSPHVMRHAFASHMLHHGANLISIQKLLGHSSLSTTEVYTHVQQEKLQDTVFNLHPLSSSYTSEDYSLPFPKKQD